MENLILASSSQYKKNLLERLGVPFSAVDSHFDESSLKEVDLPPLELSKALAREKARAVASSNLNSFVIGADQVCHFQNTLLSKAGGFDKAFEQLKNLQGHTHELITSYCIIYNNQEVIHSNVTQLKMKNLSDNQIKTYLQYDKPYDCAGSYKIESGGIGLFEEVFTSDFTAIIGLPLIQLSIDLQKTGFKLWNQE